MSETTYADGRMFDRAVAIMCDSYGIDEAELQRRLECFWRVEDWPADERAALFHALLEAEGYRKRWAIAKPDGSIELVDGEDPVAAADLVPSWRAVPIYVPLQREEPE